MPDAIGFEEAVSQRINSQMSAMIDAIAGTMGTPPGSKTYTKQEEIDEWLFSPISDPQERMNKALEMHMQGATGETITDFLYPNLRRLIGTGRTRPDEQIKFAREMRKAVGWPDMAASADETELPLEMQVAMAGSQTPQPAPVAAPPMMPPAQEPMPVQAPVAMPQPQQPAILPAFAAMGGVA